MVNYENMHDSEVQRLAKQGNKDALFEMAWRLDEVLPGEYNLVERTAWDNIWYEKAAEAGHVDAKSRIAHNYYMMSYNGAAVKYRQMAMKYYQELSNDLDSGKLDGDDRDFGETAKIWLGIMLCMGHGLPLRDVEKGMKHIEEVEKLTNYLEGYGFIPLYELGKMYGQGYAQSDEIPLRLDLEKAIKYLKTALKRSKTQKIVQGMIENAEIVLEEVMKVLEIIVRGENLTNISLFNSWVEFEKLKAIERRIEMMELSDEKKRQVDAYEAALKLLQERLARDGWLNI